MFKFNSKFNFIFFLTLTLQACANVNVKEDHEIKSPAMKATPNYPLDFQDLIDRTVSAAIPGIVLLVETEDYKFLGSTGVADIEKQLKMPTNAMMPNASAGKTLTALLVVMLHEEGLLDINVPISQYLSEELLSQIEHSNSMTLSHLLSHTSGIYDYLNNKEVFDVVMNSPSKLKTDKYLIKFALNKPASFLPGEQFEYSNTGYLLTGLILDKVLGFHHSKAMRQRVLAPLGMNRSYYKGVEKNRNEIISGYFTNDNGHSIIGKNETINTKVMQENIGVADAPLVSTVEELALLLRMTITGSDIITGTMQDMLFGEDNLNDMGYKWYGNYNADYGKGMFTENFKNTLIYHHGGVGLGYNTNNVYIPESNISITTFANCGASDACDNKLHNMVTKILASVIYSAHDDFMEHNGK